MGIVYRKEDKHTQEQPGKTVTYCSGDGPLKTSVAYINYKPFEIIVSPSLIS